MTHARDERGAAAVEFALVLPMLLLLLCGIIDYGARYQNVHQLNGAAAVAAREMSISTKDYDLAKADALAAGISAGGPASSLEWSISPCVASNNVEVTVRTKVPTVTKFFGSTFDVTATAVARCQK